MKQQSFTRSKFCATVLSMILALHSVFGQARPPEITVTIFRDLVRFATTREVQEIRVEVFGATGKKIFDSGVAGQTLDWPLQNPQGQSVDSALYAYTVTVRDEAGILKQVQQGNVILDLEREGLEAAPPTDRLQPMSAENTQLQQTGTWDVDRGQSPYIINTPAMGIGTQNPLARLHIGAGAIEPVTKGSTLLVEEGAATGMVLKSTTGGEMFFSQDTKYGLFGTASDHPLGIRTNNQTRFWVTGEGNVGIGTTNPGSPLTVAGMIEMTSGGIKFPDGTVQSTAATSISDDPISNTDRIAKSTTRNNAADQSSSPGKRGEGGETVSPRFNVNEDLTVSGNIIFTPSPQVVRDITMQDNTGGLRFYAAPSLTNSPTAATIQVFGNNSPLPGQLFLDSGAHDNGAVIIRTAPKGGAITETMRVTATGNVGIGNPLPRERLSIGGRIHIAGNCGGGIPNVQGAHISWNQLPVSASQPCGFGETDFINHHGGGPGGFAFMNTRDGVPPLSTLMFISGSGSVGIGTTDPGQKLDVLGNIKMSGVRTKLFYRGNVDAHIGSLAFYSPNGGRTAIITPHDGAGGNIANSTIQLGGFGSFDSNTVNLNVSGNVGIGTADPGVKLEISGQGTVRNRINSDENAGIQMAIRSQPEWSLSTIRQDGEFGTIARPLYIRNDRMGAVLLSIDHNGVTIGQDIPPRQPASLTVSGSLVLKDNRTRILGFDDPHTSTGFHWFGKEFDSDLAFGIRRLGVNKYEFHFNGPIFKRGGGVSFVEDHPRDPTKEIVYVALEGPENGTYTRGIARLVAGIAVIDLPDHFSVVTNDEDITVQLTPRGTWLRLYTAQVSAKRIIVREEGGEAGNFDYLVQGVRRGYENHQVIRDKQR
jgi:hypothetical protein